jgi:hypothetical protein
VLLSWRQVASASKYTVYRYDTVTKKERLLGDVEIDPTDPAKSLYYADFVSRDNQLEDGRSYEYTVVAVNNSFNQSGMPLKNGSSKVTAKPKIPAEGSAVTANLDVEIGPGGAGVLVKFNNQPNLSYSISYVYGTNQLVYATTGSPVSQDGDVWIFEKTRYLTIPSFGGAGIVTVNYSFAGGGYYGGGTAKTQEITFDFGASGPSWGASSNFWVTRSEDTTPYTRYEWSNIGAASYEIYKAQVSGSPAFAPGGAVNINFISDWVKVDTTPAELNNGYAAVGTQGTPGYEPPIPPQWVAKEIATSNTLNYVYAIIAKNDAGQDTKFAYQTPASITTPDFDVVPRYNDKTKLQIHWEGDEGATYVLERCIADPLDDTQLTSLSNFVLRNPGEYTTVAVVKEDYVLGWAVVIDDDPPIGDAYVYKLTASKWGATAAPKFFVIDDGVFTNSTNFTIAKYTEPVALSNNAFNALSVKIAYAGTAPEANIARTIQLYRKVSSSSGNNSLSPYEPIGPAYAWSAGQADHVFPDTVPDTSLKYDYRIVIYNADGVPVPNKNAQATDHGKVTEIIDLTAYSYGYKLGKYGTNAATSYNENGIYFGPAPIYVSIIEDATITSGSGSFGGVATTGNPNTGGITYEMKKGLIIIDYGKELVVDNHDDQYTNEGPSILGMSITIEYAIHDTTITGTVLTTGTYATKTATLPVEVFAKQDTATAGQTTTHYLYYIQLPNGNDITATPGTGGVIADAPTLGFYADPADVETDFDDDYIVAREYSWGPATTGGLSTTHDRLNVKKF